MPDKNKTIKTYNQFFEKALQQLNPAQQEAVEKIEGPVLVIAGPGTGKTHILAARVGNILLKTDTQAHNILCLTFTDAGVHAMRERLLSFIGPEAHRVHIYTFHSFCNTIIQDNMELFGRHDLEALSELERVELIRKLIDELPIDHPLKRGKRDPYFYENQLYNLFGLIKTEDWSIAFVNEKIDAYLASLPMRPEYIYQRKTKEFNKGDLKKWKIDDTHERMERLRAAAKLFERFQDLMYNARRYDFDDMILWVLRAFEEHEALRRKYQEQYLYFLVDEYQDTNGAQNNIIHQLIDYWVNPNVFIVGDDDQSIFEFQGARLKNLLDFHEQFKADLQLIILKNNYRSTQSILDSSKTLIDQNSKRIINTLPNIDKNLTASNHHLPADAPKPSILQFPNRLQEDVAIIEQIEQLRAKGVPLENIAILYAKHKQVKYLLTLLQKKAIPYTTKRWVNILDLPLIQNIRLLLEYIYQEYEAPYTGEHALFKIMHFDFLKIEANDLASLSSYIARQALAQKPVTWRDTLVNKAQLEKLNFANPDPIFKFAALLPQLISDYGNCTLIVFIERLINRSGLLAHLIQQEEKIWLIQVINSFFEFVQREADRNPRIKLNRLLQIFNNMDSNRLAIRIQQNISIAKGVQLSTAHSAKGLEFEYVFLLDCVKDQWEPAKNQSTYAFPLPDTLSLSGEEDAMESRRRLFYVAMTRAKSFLQLSFSEKNRQGKRLERTRYLDELMQGEGLAVQATQLGETQLAAAQILALTEMQKPRIPSADRAVIAELLEGFTLSISSLNRFLRCPLSFYYQNVLRIPSTTSEAASYGIAMHYALKKLFDKMLLSPEKEFPSIDDFVLFFEKDLKRQSYNLTKKEYERRRLMGQTNLKLFYQENIHRWPTTILPEYTIRNVEVEGVPLTGTIDKVDLLGEQAVHMVDYKTGSMDAAKIRRPTPKNPMGGLYWRQLVFYKILFEHHKQGKLQASSGEIAYLEPDRTGQFSRKNITYQVEDVQIVKALIKDSYEKIMQQDFYEGCGEKHCPWCNFVQDNVPLNSLRDEEAEDLDD